MWPVVWWDFSFFSITPRWGEKKGTGEKEGVDEEEESACVGEERMGAGDRAAHQITVAWRKVLC